MLKVEWAADGEAALEFLFAEGRRPRLILLDVMMPGRKVLYRIESHPETRDIPVRIEVESEVGAGTTFRIFCR